MTRKTKIALVAATLAALALGGTAIASPKWGDCPGWGDRAANSERAQSRMMGMGPMRGDFDRNWTADDVRKVFDGMLTRHGEKRLKV
ncbi:MAG: hypothetical protein FJX47_15570, partial [Alphaproteobacteria bacterium]|nr:hypothetical protein [Alphaproteobacteria bacterium]